MADFYPAVSGDDGHSKDAGFEAATDYINLGNDGGIYYAKLFIRFPGATIPAETSIFSAVLTLTAYATLSGGPPSVDIRFNDVDDAVAPTNKDELDALALTTAYTTWDVPSTTADSEYTSPDLSAALQEVIDRPGWASGQDLQIVMAYNTSAIRKWYAYDSGGGVKKAKLTVTYGTIYTKDFTSTPLIITSEITFGVGINGDLSESLPMLTCAATGTWRGGFLIQDLPRFLISATGISGAIGALNTALPKLQISASGLCGQVGSFDQLLPRLGIVANGYTLGMAWADLTLPMLRIYASGRQLLVIPEYLVLAMNPKNMAVSEYDWSGFNSFAYFNGQYLGAKAGTIHVLGGNDDAGSIIESEIELGQIAVDSVKPRDVYVLGRASGMMAMTFQADEDTEKEVNIPYMLKTLNLDRAKIPRGIKPTYFSLKLENKNGSDFDIDEIQVWGEIIGRGRP